MDLHVVLHNPVIKQGTAPTLRFTAYDNEGVERDLSGIEWVSVIFKRWHTSVEAIINAYCAVTDAEMGEFELELGLEDTSGDGRYIGEVEIAFGDNSMDRSEDLVIWMVPSIRSNS